MNSTGEYTSNLSQQYPNISLDFPYQFSGGVIALNFSDGKSSAIISQSGELVAQTEYDEIGTFFYGIAVCKKGDKFGYVDSLGNERLEPIYDGVTAIHQGIGFVQDGDSLFKFTDQ